MRVTAIVILGLLVSYPLAAATSVVSYAETKAQASAAESDFQKWMDSLKSSGIEARAGSVAFDAADDTLLIKGLTLTTAVASASVGKAAQLRVGAISMKSFTAGPDGYRFEGLTANDISTVAAIDAPPSATVRQLTVGKSFLPSFAGFTADPKKPVSSQIKMLSILAKMTTDNVDVSEFSAGSNLQISKIELRTIDSGTIKTMMASGIAAKSLPSNQAGVADDAVGDVSIGEASISGISMRAYIQLFDDSAYLSAGAARPWSNFVESATLKGVAVKNGALSVAIASADLTTLKIRQFPENITQIFDAAASDPIYLQNNPSEAQKLANSVRQAFTLAAAHLTGFKITTQAKNGEAVVSIGAAQIANLSAGHVDHLEMSDGAITDSDGTIALRSLRLADVTLPSTATVSSPAEGNSSAGAKVSIPTIGSISSEGLDVRVGEMRFGLDRLNIAMAYFIGSTPTSLKASVDHIKFPVAQVANLGLRQTFTDLGYQDMDLSVELSGAWQDSASALAFDAIKIMGADMGTLTLSGSLTGVTRQGIEDPRYRMGSEIMAGGLQNFRLSFENASLFDRFITQAAKANKKTPEEFKKILSSNMPAIMAKIASPVVRNKFVFAAVSFLNTPNKLDLSASTSDVIPVKDVLGAFQNPAELPTVLKLDASANDRK